MWADVRGDPAKGSAVLALFCLSADRIEQDRASAKLSVVGLFDHLRAATFPHVVDNIGVMARFELSAAESGREVTANVALVDASGRRVHLDQRARLLPHVEAGRPPVWDFALNLSRVPFDAPGRYEFVFRVDKEIVAAAPIWVLSG